MRTLEKAEIVLRANKAILQSFVSPLKCFLGDIALFSDLTFWKRDVREKMLDKIGQMSWIKHYFAFASHAFSRSYKLQNMKVRTKGNELDRKVVDGTITEEYYYLSFCRCFNESYLLKVSMSCKKHKLFVLSHFD